MIEREHEERTGNFLVSVIVPIYNTEQYLPCCIDSIINQTYRNIEIILVDDGSADKSLEICNDYAKKDSRIIVVDEQHQGLVPARKIGVKKAKGVYCIFVDSDDWIDSHLIETTVAQAEDNDVDIVNYNLYAVYSERKIKWEYLFTDGIYEGAELEKIYEKMMFDFQRNKPGIIQSLWSKLIKRSILLDAIEPEDDRITYGEDAAVVYVAMLNAEKIAITSQPLYFYRIHAESMMHKLDINKFEKVYFFYSYMKSNFLKYGNKYNLEGQLQAYILSFLISGLKECFSMDIKICYKLPTNLFNKKNKVVLYGAGYYGTLYYEQIRQLYEDQIELVAWVDKNMEGQIIYGVKIDAPEILNSIEYDNIILAVKNQIMAEEIKRELRDLNIKKHVLWTEPIKQGYVIGLNNNLFNQQI